jgi:hypothetical protein
MMQYFYPARVSMGQTLFTDCAQFWEQNSSPAARMALRWVTNMPQCRHLIIWAGRASRLLDAEFLGEADARSQRMKRSTA